MKKQASISLFPASRLHKKNLYRGLSIFHIPTEYFSFNTNLGSFPIGNKLVTTTCQVE